MHEIYSSRARFDFVCKKLFGSVQFNTLSPKAAFYCIFIDKYLCTSLSSPHKLFQVLQRIKDWCYAIFVKKILNF